MSVSAKRVVRKAVNMINYFDFQFSTDFQYIRRLFEGKSGIEIGGPSALFRSELPVYDWALTLDGVNFNTFTVWEGQINEGPNYHYTEQSSGFQFIREASDLSGIADETYDFLLASHCLEHCANPIKTLLEWKRVVKKNGLLLLVLPDKRFTFDHKRPITKLDHLIDDFNQNKGEDDLTHMEEILQLHDISMDPPSQSIEFLKARSLKNFENRCFHHHVFDFELLQQLFEFTQVRVERMKFLAPFHQIIIGRKV